MKHTLEQMDNVTLEDTNRGVAHHKILVCYMGVAH